MVLLAALEEPNLITSLIYKKDMDFMNMTINISYFSICPVIHTFYSI